MFRIAVERAGACTVTANQRRHDLPAALTRTNLRLPAATTRQHDGEPLPDTHLLTAVAATARAAPLDLW